MKIPLIVPFAVLPLFFAACEQKSAQITASSPTPSLTPAEAAETPENFAGSPSSLAEAPPAAAVEQRAPEASAAPSTNAASTNRPVFHSEAATQTAIQYLNSYNAVLDDANEAPKSRPANPQAAVEDLKSQLQKLARDTAQLENQQRQVDSQLTPDEKKRLLQYQKNLEQQ